MSASNRKTNRKQWFGQKKDELKTLKHYAKLIKTSYEAMVKHDACEQFQYDPSSGKERRRQSSKE